MNDCNRLTAWRANSKCYRWRTLWLSGSALGRWSAKPMQTIPGRGGGVRWKGMGGFTAKCSMQILYNAWDAEGCNQSVSANICISIWLLFIWIVYVCVSHTHAIVTIRLKLFMVAFDYSSAFFLSCLLFNFSIRLAPTLFIVLLLWYFYFGEWERKKEHREHVLLFDTCKFDTWNT